MTQGKWHGGKGSTSRKGANNDAYRDNWEKIFRKKDEKETKSK